MSRALDFNSRVHPLKSSCTSSAETSVRCHASVHWGFVGASLAFNFACLFAAESLLQNAREKKGIIPACDVTAYLFFLPSFS